MQNLLQAQNETWIGKHESQNSIVHLFGFIKASFTFFLFLFFRSKLQNPENNAKLRAFLYLLIRNLQDLHEHIHPRFALPPWKRKSKWVEENLQRQKKNNVAIVIVDYFFKLLKERTFFPYGLVLSTGTWGLIASTNAEWTPPYSS